MKYNPYKPGHIIHTGMFCGREFEIRAIKRALVQTKNGNPQNFIIQGERGIGKSSLLFYAEDLAKSPTHNHKFLIVSFELESHFGFLDIVNKMIVEIKTQLKQVDKFRSYLDEFLKILSQIETEVIKFKNKETEIYSTIADIAHLMKKIIESKKVEGILILIDEADRPPQSSNLGAFLKLLTERLTKISCNEVCIGLSGLSEVMERLEGSHESSLRLFNVLSLEVLKGTERIEVIKKGLAEANQKNDVITKITEEAIQEIVDLSQGYPYFLQQFAYNCFEADTDNNIDKKDVGIGLFDKKTGALKQLGERFFNNIYFREIESLDYRKFLKYMSQFLDGWISRGKIIENSGLHEHTVDNALSSLKKKNIILYNRDKKGEYRLPSKSFAIWINIFTEHQERNGN